MRTRKKILMLTPIFPLPLKSGGQVRIFNMIKHLSGTCDITLISLLDRHELKYQNMMDEYCKKVHPVVVDVHDTPWEKALSFCTPGQISRTIKRFAQFGAGSPMQICRFYHRTFQQRLREVITQNHFNVVHAVYAQMAPYLTQAKRLDGNIKTILVDIDLSFLPFQRELSTKKGFSQWLSRLECNRLVKYVSKTWPTFDRILLMSENDGEKLKQIAPDSKTEIIPNGVDIEYFSPSGPSCNALPSSMVFLGGSRHQPNVDAMNFFFKEIFPHVRKAIPEVTLRIVGDFDRNLLPPNTEGVELTGFVEDIRPHIRNGSLFIVPLRIGGGTRLKILEAMALGVPVISTSVGYEGIDAVPDRDLLVRDDPRQFAEGILWALQNKEILRSLAANGRRVIEKKYDWKTIAVNMDEVYENLLEKDSEEQTVVSTKEKSDAYVF